MKLQALLRGRKRRKQNAARASAGSTGEISPLERTHLGTTLLETKGGITPHEITSILHLPQAAHCSVAGSTASFWDEFLAPDNRRRFTNAFYVASGPRTRSRLLLPGHGAISRAVRLWHGACVTTKVSASVCVRCIHALLL